MLVVFLHTERNLNPKQACLKRREEEKGEIPSSLSGAASAAAASVDPLSGNYCDAELVVYPPYTNAFIGSIFHHICYYMPGS